MACRRCARGRWSEGGIGGLRPVGHAPLVRLADGGAAAAPDGDEPLEGGRPLLDYCCVLVLKEEAATATGSPARGDAQREATHGCGRLLHALHTREADRALVCVM